VTHATAALALVACAATRPLVAPDPWGPLRWSMSVDEVRAALGASFHETPGSDGMTAFWGHDGVAEVHVVAHGKLDLVQRTWAGVAAGFGDDRIAELRARFGAPAREKRSGSLVLASGITGRSDTITWADGAWLAVIDAGPDLSSEGYHELAWGPIGWRMGPGEAEAALRGMGFDLREQFSDGGLGLTVKLQAGPVSGELRFEEGGLVHLEVEDRTDGEAPARAWLGVAAGAPALRTTELHTVGWTPAPGLRVDVQAVRDTDHAGRSWDVTESLAH
jgi:hypothetical protein